MRWLKKACESSESLRVTYESNAYTAAWQLAELASDYLAFESAFTYPSIGLLELRLEGNRIAPSENFRKHSRFHARDNVIIIDVGLRRPLPAGTRKTMESANDLSCSIPIRILEASYV